MNQLKKIGTKIVTSIIIFGMLISLVGINSISAAEVKEYNGDYYHLIQEGNKITMTDKKTNESIIIELDGINNATLILEDGSTKEFHRENPLNVVETTSKSPVSRMGVPIPSYVNPSKFSYTYFQTSYTNTKTSGEIQSIALGILSFMPYFGSIFAVVGIIETARNLGAKVVYIKTNEYYAQGYQYYKYHSYFYTNSSYKNSYSNKINYVKMW